mmetsp:Transcript_65277/g.212607  ORF Transcript_65277/g.212607 Transcript_65277/m.212607 type:complete len:536 (-) Transcript_65277:440-2047(-)
MDLGHFRQLRVPVWQAVEVTLAATAIRSHRRPAQISRGANATETAERIAWLVVEELRMSGIPPSGARDSPVAISAAVPALTWCNINIIVRGTTCSIARCGDVVQNQIDNDLNTRCTAIGHHASKFFSTPRTRAQPERNRLVLRPPLRTALMLCNRRDLHGIEAVWPEVLLALPCNVIVVPLPQLHEDRSPAIPSATTTGALLELTEVTVDGSVGVDLVPELQSRRRRRSRRRRGRVGFFPRRVAKVVAHDLELLPSLDRARGSQNGAPGACGHVEAVGCLERDSSVLVLDHQEFLPAADLRAIRDEGARGLRGDVPGAGGKHRDGAVRIGQDLEARVGTVRLRIGDHDLEDSLHLQISAVEAQKRHRISTIVCGRPNLHAGPCRRGCRGTQGDSRGAAPHLTVANLEHESVAAQDAHTIQALGLRRRFLAELVQPKVRPARLLKKSTAQICLEGSSQVAIPERAQIASRPIWHMRSRRWRRLCLWGTCRGSCCCAGRGFRRFCCCAGCGCRGGCRRGRPCTLGCIDCRRNLLLDG